MHSAVTRTHNFRPCGSDVAEGTHPTQADAALKEPTTNKVIGGTGMRVYKTWTWPFDGEIQWLMQGRVTSVSDTRLRHVSSLTSSATQRQS